MLTPAEFFLNVDYSLVVKVEKAGKLARCVNIFLDERVFRNPSIEPDRRRYERDQDESVNDHFLFEETAAKRDPVPKQVDDHELEEKKQACNH